MLPYGRPFTLLSDRDKNTIEVVDPIEKTKKEKIGEAMIIISKIIMFNSLFAFACSPAWLLFTDDATYMLKGSIASVIFSIYGICMYAVGQIIRNDN